MEQPHLSSVDPVHGGVVREQQLGEHLPVPLVVVDPVEAGLLHVGNQGHAVGHPVQLELLKGGKVVGKKAKCGIT